MELDRFDRRILALLQEDSTIPIADLAAQIGLSQTPCWKRLKRLETEGYLKRRVALVDRVKVGLPVVVFVSVKTNQHDEAWLTAFAKGATALPEVVEFYRLAGDIDYLLKVLIADINAYDQFYRKLIRCAPLADVSSSFAMEQIKYTTSVPLAV